MTKQKPDVKYSLKRQYGNKLFLIVICLSLCHLSCKKNPVGPAQPHVRLSVNNIGTTEVWLTIGFTGGGEYAINRDGNTVMRKHFDGNDTTVVDDSLTPGRSYTYQAQVLSGSTSYSSSPVQVRTMDSTSHGFTWQSFVLGDGNSSVLNDVAIINDTLIYAVGEIYLRDSTGQIDLNAYNLAKWDGRNWQLMRVYFYTFCGQPHMGSYPSKAILALSSADIWIAGAGEVTRWNGYSQSEPVCVELPSPFDIYKLWGSDSNSVYAVGYGGNIAWYHNNRWQQLASGTSQNILNIWGTNVKVLCITAESKILNLSSTPVTDTLNWPGSIIRGLWFEETTPVLVSGDGVWSNDGMRWSQMNGLPNYFYTGIRGTAINDLFAIGWQGVAVHYNGWTWNQYSEIANSIWNYESLSIKNETIAIVGFEGLSIGGRAIVIIGRRTL